MQVRIRKGYSAVIDEIEKFYISLRYTYNQQMLIPTLCTSKASVHSCKTWNRLQVELCYRTDRFALNLSYSLASHSIWNGRDMKLERCASVKSIKCSQIRIFSISCVRLRGPQSFVTITSPPDSIKKWNRPPLPPLILRFRGTGMSQFILAR